MRRAIQQLEQTAKTLEPTPTQRDEWDRGVQNYAHDFLDHIEEGKAYQPSENGAGGIPEYSFGDVPKPLEEVLGVLKKNIHGCGLNPASGGHLGYIPGGGIYPTAMGDYLAAVTNQYAGIFFAGPGAVRIENMLLRWMCRLVGYPETALGNLASGGSVANLIAFVTARDFKEITTEKVRTSVIYLTEQVHHCVHKAIRIGGMAEAIVRTVPMDGHYRMNAAEMKKRVQQAGAAGFTPFLVVAPAGTTDPGAMDPLKKIGGICREHDLWFHVDAAYGGFFLLADVENPGGSAIKESFEGIEQSDSVAIDPHKGLFLSYGVGAVLIKNVKAQMATHYYRASYMQDADITSDELNPADLSPELTKHWRGLRMWLPLQLYGLQPFKAALEEKIWLCRYFYEEIQKAGFEVGPYPDLSVCIYRYVPESGDANEFNLRLVEQVQRDGRVFISSTTIDGVVWLRLAVLCFRTHLREIDILLEVFKSGVAHLR